VASLFALPAYPAAANPLCLMKILAKALTIIFNSKEEPGKHKKFWGWSIWIKL